jgi:integrase/recombinase XerD
MVEHPQEGGSTMWEELFSNPSTITHHENAPYREERERYLLDCARQGYTRGTRRGLARELLWIARKVCISAEHAVDLEQLETAAQNWKLRKDECHGRLNPQSTRKRFILVAKKWFRFLGCWNDHAAATKFDHLIESFSTWMEKERGFTPLTIHRRCGHLKLFLRWFENQDRPFSAVTLDDIDTYLSICGAGGNGRTSLNNIAGTLRTFFAYAGSQELCASSIAPGIQGPRIFEHEQLPSGPTWPDVKRLLESMQPERESDIRDKAIILLFAIYGFRSSEVASLRLDDIDWERSLLSVSRAKRRMKQTYPLIPLIGEAIILYLRDVRPRCSRREVFLTLLPPFRPLSRECLRSVVAIRMKNLGIKSTRYGPHALRHACATHLLSEGLSLKEIGDHLGHQSTSATRIYAKVDLAGLREVAAFDIGGLL